MEYISPVTGRRRLAGFGSYPDVPLTEAREKRDAFRKLVRQGRDPLDVEAEKKAARKREKEEQDALLQTFEKTAWEWFNVKCRGLAEKTRNQTEQRIRYLAQHIGKIPLKDLRVADVSKALEPLFDRVESCQRLAGAAHSVSRYGASMGYVDGDFLSALSDVLPKKPSVTHHAAITDPKELGALLRAIDEYNGDISTCYCLKILPYVFTRSNEIRNARWSEFDLDAGIWQIPPGRMKMKRGHVVPLARQVVDMLQELKEHTGFTGLLFPSPHDRRRGLSDVALLTALRRMGYGKDEMSIHGFRAVARTLLDEQLHCDRNAIELQLAHIIPGPMGETYNRSEYLDARRNLMQRWADYLDELKERAGRKA